MKLRQNLLIGIACVAFSFFFVACQCMYDELSRCPQGLVFTFVSQTPCGKTLSLKDMKDVQIQIYDAQNNRVATFNKSDIKVSDDDKLLFDVPFYVPGTYNITVWGRYDGDKTYASTEKASMALIDNSEVIEHDLPPLFYGQIKAHTINEIEGTKYDSLAVNMLPYVSYFNLHVKNLYSSSKYRVTVYDDNRAFNPDGNVISSPIVYTRLLKEDKGVFYSHFNTLKIRRESNAYITITDFSEKKEIFKASLSDLFNAYEVASSEAFNPDCEKELTLDISVDTNQRIIVKINGWNLVLRNIDLG